ncbi:ABC transporter ATP-binding protein [Macellibacteroides fermentans]|jgi:putative ABC transport system ATP-binding protein|uniref:Putative ABC transport system ATP-binding protein n=1 Tax=Macellibacteroides fermentans TaxID=879969 RepID=A0A8E2D5S9_9PORP|nr:ABC transporter ATP-binding protein [Macellibacteroides fermentans]MBP6231090.1 ABC transporter ATP-binding protein [Paludibacteraceae bacterium]NYI50105.1 putative ABC transport system ATP-binding protein [Macellibacteroides fermentans]
MIELQNIHKSYITQYTSLHVLRGINLSIENGEMISIMGASGSGKSTLLNVLGLLDRFDEGKYCIDGISTNGLTMQQRAYYRNKLLGFVFQSSNLIAYKNLVENVALPLYYRGISRKQRNILAIEQLDMLGLKDWATHFPNELSGGQKQRVAIARALIAKPSLILADEPTGQLDSSTAIEVINLLKEINKKGTTMIIVTHEIGIAQQTNRIIKITDGQIE